MTVALETVKSCG